MRLLKIIKIILIILLVCWLGVFGWFVFPQLGCGSESASNQVPESQVITVQRGDLRIDITAVGNLALSRTEDLAFDIFYLEAAVEEVLVEEGDTVEEGQVVARLGTSEWERELATLESSVTKEKASYTTAIVTLEKAESVAYTADLEMEIKQQQVERAQQQYWEAIIRFDYGESTEADLLEAATALRTAEAALAAVTTDPLQIEAKQLQVQLTEAQFKDAERELAEALESSPEVKAPFAGFITKVNVEGGDEIKKGTVAVTLADPTKFEADVMVSEMDILQVKLGGDATVQVDAMQGVSLPAKVTHISPTATIQQGVVNYKVKVEIQSLKDFQLREGLTVTVSILVEEKNDVLLVPNQAIIRRGRQTLVQVLKDGVIEERAITTGISNWQYTEVTDGLSEGEKVVIPETTTPTTSQQGGRIPFLPGGGRPH